MKEEKLKYLVIGAGGTGGAIGSHMANAEHDVTFIARGRHLAAMRENGLKVSRPDGEFVIDPVKAFTTEEFTELCVKSKKEGESPHQSNQLVRACKLCTPQEARDETRTYKSSRSSC